MRSVRENNTLQEDWQAPTDSTAEWSHCPLAPLFVTFMDIAGIRPLSPGFERCRIQPQLGDLPDLDLTAWTPRGPVEFSAVSEPGGHRVRLKVPEGCQADLVVTETSQVPGERAAPPSKGLATYRVAGGRTLEFHLARH